MAARGGSGGPTPVAIVVPALDDSGPVRGAVALANGLAETTPVWLVALKPSPGCAAPIDPRVRTIRLEGGWWARLRGLRRLLDPADGTARPVSLSFCLHADVATWLVGGGARTMSSVRANMPQNYRYDFGVLGWPLAAAHLLMLRRFDLVVAMSESMQAQLRRWGIRRLARIGNFIDESSLPAGGRSAAGATARLVHVGNLNRRKRVDLLLRAVAAVRGDGVPVALDIVGDGPLRASLEHQARSLGLGEAARFHGQVRDPAPVVGQADYLVLASESEGVSRAMLEALHLGVPCIVRDADGNGEVIRPGCNGYLFRHDDELPEVLRRAVAARGRFAPGRSLLPDNVREAPALAAFRALVAS